MRNRSVSPWRLDRRTGRSFHLIETHNPQTRKEPHHGQDETHRGLRRSSIRRRRNGAAGRPHPRWQHRAPPSPPPRMADASATSTAPASLGNATASTPTSASSAAKTRLALVGKTNASRRRRPPAAGVFIASPSQGFLQRRQNGGCLPSSPSVPQSKGLGRTCRTRLKPDRAPHGPRRQCPPYRKRRR